MATSHAFAPATHTQISTMPCSKLAFLHTTATAISPSTATELHMFKEYGDTSQPVEDDSAQTMTYQQQLAAFKDLLNQVIHVNKRENLPRICTQNIDLLVTMKGSDSVSICNAVMEEARLSNDQALIDNTEAAIQYVVYFVETFVAETKSLDMKNKTLLGEIIKHMIGRTELTQKIDIEDLPSETQREQNLNAFLAHNKEQFTPVFLRHLDGECQRIQNAPQSTPESLKLLEMIRMIQARIIEELGQDLGEGAQVLGQLIGYESKDERLAVLEAGLSVRGVDFAKELNAMTLEALEGFRNAVTGADPGLVAIVQEINDYIQIFITNNERREYGY